MLALMGPSLYVGSGKTPGSTIRRKIHVARSQSTVNERVSLAEMYVKTIHM